MSKKRHVHLFALIISVFFLMQDFFTVTLMCLFVGVFSRTIEPILEIIGKGCWWSHRLYVMPTSQLTRALIGKKSKTFRVFCDIVGVGNFTFGLGCFHDVKKFYKNFET